MTVQTGHGKRVVSQGVPSPLDPSFRSSPGCHETWEEEAPPSLKRPVLLLGDSMAQCIPITDSVFMPVTKDSYQFEHILRDINNDLIDVQYKHIVVWAGAHAIHSVKLAEVPAHLKALANAIWSRNSSAHVFVSSLLPKPRENHIAGDLIVAYNRGIKTAVNFLKQQGSLISYLQSHSLVLDQDRNILRLIIDNFEDGFHLNLHGAHRLRKFWLQQLGLNK